MKKISKTLSANDTGETGAHQAGILVPKNVDALGFFPTLDPKSKNPRLNLIFTDEAGARWEFTFIYYNNRFFGGTRNEFRLTRMTRYFRAKSLKAGDEVLFSKDRDASMLIRFERAESVTRDADGVLRLGSGWKVISY